jgi:hypothetical protein
MTATATQRRQQHNTTQQGDFNDTTAPARCAQRYTAFGCHGGGGTTNSRRNHTHGCTHTATHTHKHARTATPSDGLPQVNDDVIKAPLPAAAAKVALHREEACEEVDEPVAVRTSESEPPLGSEGAQRLRQRPKL